ncbi:MAG: class I SAM-dependent methyltransferase [Balneolaceae bacterium]
MKKIKEFGGNILSAVMPEFWKSYSELVYWKRRKNKEGDLSNDHYDYFYTEHFQINHDEYTDKRVLDIGCGPRGSLEWATMANERIGLDPLADKYLKLGADQHKMKYVTSGSEQIPFRDSYFDIVCSFNSLDHVKNVEESIAEIKRVTAPNGLFLLMVEANHKPTNCEPHEIKPEIIKQFEPEFECLMVDFYLPVESGLYESVKAQKKLENPLEADIPGWLSVKFRKI